MTCPPLECSRRRTLQAAGCTGVATLSGCLSSISNPASSCSERTNFSLDRAKDSYLLNEFSTPVDSLSYASRIAVRDAFETDEATSQGYYVPHPRTEYVVTEQGEHYYQVEYTVHNRIETPGYEYSVKIGIDESTLSDDEAVHHFTELPAQDRKSIHSALENKVKIRAPHFTSFSVVFAYVSDELRQDSQFAPNTDTEYVEWEDTLLRLKFDDKRSVKVTRATVTANLVAESYDEFVEYIHRGESVALDDLTRQQREIVIQATKDGYNECKPYSESYTALLDQLSMDERDFVRLVQYDSDWYFTQISRR